MSHLGSLDLLAAGFSASIGVEVLPPPRAASIYQGGAANYPETIQKLTIYDLFHISHTMVPREMPPCTTAGDIEVNIRGMTGATTMLKVSLGTTIAEMKKMASDKLGITNALKFMFDRKVLEDENTVEMEEIPHGCTIHFIVLMADPDRIANESYVLDPALLARNYDYDFTEKRDGNEVYMRGQYRYYRPCGWYRYAVAVVDKFGDNAWLGPNGIRTSTSPGEWPVSYHGTKMRDESEVVKQFRHGQEYVPGVYSSPSLDMIEEHYAQTFEFEGIRYKLAMQNRINPDKAGGHMKIIPKEHTKVGADYWVSPVFDDVRPYGIIIKEL